MAGPTHQLRKSRRGLQVVLLALVLSIACTVTQPDAVSNETRTETVSGTQVAGSQDRWPAGFFEKIDAVKSERSRLLAKYAVIRRSINEEWVTLGDPSAETVALSSIGEIIDEYEELRDWMLTTPVTSELDRQIVMLYSAGLDYEMWALMEWHKSLSHSVFALVHTNDTPETSTLFATAFRLFEYADALESGVATTQALY